MKKLFLTYLAAAMSLLSQPVFSQTEDDTPALGLPGDNLDLYAVLTLFQKSKTIEEFEKSLNEQKTGINNLDLDLDKKVDFIKVVTKKDDLSFTFILQVAVSKTETQDVAVILVNKDKNGKVTMQIVGDEELYGKNYVIEPSDKGSPSVTANPGYVGSDPVTKDVPATTTVVVQSAPIVQYVYSPVYVPYYPPYHYGYYPPYFAAFTVMAVGIYRHNNYYSHGGYYGGHYHGGGNTVIINDRDRYNNYNNNKMRSNTVADNKSGGRYNNNASNRAGTGASASTRPSSSTSNRGSVGASASTRPSTSPSNRGSMGQSASTRQSTAPSMGTSASTRQSNSYSPSTRASSSPRPSSNYSSGSSRGGGRSMGGGGGMRAGGGGGRRR